MTSSTNLGPEQVRRSKAELVQELTDQLELLQSSCTQFDAGKLIHAKEIANKIRLLLHHTKQSKSLLGQLGLRDSLKVLDSAPPLNPKNLMTTCKLVAVCAASSGEAFYVPLYSSFIAVPGATRSLKFSEWWSMDKIIKDNKFRTFSRVELLLTVANKDGGSHVDPDLPKEYVNLTRDNSLGWSLASSDKNIPLGSPHPACIRQIAHELLLSIEKHDPSFFRTPYVFASDLPA